MQTKDELTPAECKELGIGEYEERVIRLKVSAEVAWLKGLQYDHNGVKLENQQDSTEPGWDDEIQRIEKAIGNLSDIDLMWIEQLKEV